MLKVEGRWLHEFFKDKKRAMEEPRRSISNRVLQKKRINLILKAEISAPNLTKLLALKLISVLSNNKVH